jgi:hypothetical protein
MFLARRIKIGVYRKLVCIRGHYFCGPPQYVADSAHLTIEFGKATCVFLQIQVVKQARTEKHKKSDTEHADKRHSNHQLDKTKPTLIMTRMICTHITA